MPRCERDDGYGARTRARGARSDAHDATHELRGAHDLSVARIVSRDQAVLLHGARRRRPAIDGEGLRAMPPQAVSEEHTREFTRAIAKNILHHNLRRVCEQYADYEGGGSTAEALLQSARATQFHADGPKLLPAFLDDMMGLRAWSWTSFYPVNRVLRGQALDPSNIPRVTRDFAAQMAAASLLFRWRTPCDLVTYRMDKVSGDFRAGTPDSFTTAGIYSTSLDREIVESFGTQPSTTRSLRMYEPIGRMLVIRVPAGSLVYPVLLSREDQAEVALPPCTVLKRRGATRLMAFEAAVAWVTQYNVVHQTDFLAGEHPVIAGEDAVWVFREQRRLVLEPHQWVGGRFTSRDPTRLARIVKRVRACRLRSGFALSPIVPPVRSADWVTERLDDIAFAMEAGDRELASGIPPPLCGDILRALPAPQDRFTTNEPHHKRRTCARDLTHYVVVTTNPQLVLFLSCDRYGDASLVRLAEVHRDRHGETRLILSTSPDRVSQTSEHGELLVSVDGMELWRRYRDARDGYEERQYVFHEVMLTAKAFRKWTGTRNSPLTYKCQAILMKEFGDTERAGAASRLLVGPRPYAADSRRIATPGFS